jgi:arsenate reductase (thioredoxin)
MNVLFVCIHNSARSQMAEELLRRLGGSEFNVESAGLNPGELNSFVVRVLKEMNIDISGKKTQSVTDVLKKNKSFDYVITVCDETSAEQCPVFSGLSKRLHWGFEDPSAFKGTDDEKLNKTRVIRDQIQTKILQWLKELRESA